MSVDQLPPGKARPAKRDAQLVRYDEYIDKQIETTRRNVKAVDVVTALLVMATGTLAFLLAAAVVEHWFVTGGFNVAVRLLLFVALVGGLSFYATRRLWPLCVGSINPAYAAQAIEQDNPSLKNSLLNLLLFRQHRDDITDAVYETLEEQAAQRLTHVPVDSAVDRTQLLRLGYVLMVIVAAAALYKILSPKDPFVTAERVLMPWASIVPASRVSIENVEPGTATLARGEVLAVSADVRGIGDDDPVVVRYTTADGQAVDRPAPMTPSAAGLRFTGQIPPPQDAARGGVAQNLRYRIEAGDARSLEYSVTVVSAPTITVERIDYDYPEYTGFANRSIERLGDVRAIEGTRVIIHARANQPIEEAAVDFEADGRRDVRFEASGSDARATFLLELRDDRQTPKYTSYVLRFTGTDGRPNRDPVKFPIDVLPDHGPEVAILAPAEKVRDVRLDETVAIEVDARDPDFALAEVRLHGDAAGRTVLDERLLAEKHTGRFTGRRSFTPSEHDLQAGDVVRYWVTARDNRAPQPNEVTSDSQSLRIVAPDPRQPGQPPQDRVAQREKREPQAGDQSQEGQQQNDGGQSGSESNSSEGGEQQPGESASADGQSGQSDEQNSAEQSGESETGGKSSGDGQSSAGEQSGESGETQQQPGGAPSAGKNGESSERDQPQQSTGSESSGEQRDANQSEANPGTNGQGGGERENPSGRDGSKNTKPQPGNGGQSKPGDESSPVSPEGDNDGEAFERIQDFLKREGKLPKESQEQDGDAKSQPGESASADGNQSEDDKRNAEPNGEGDAQSNSDDQANPKADPTSEQTGTETRPGESQEKSNEPSDQGKPSQPSGGQQTSSEGESGAGDQPEQGEGSPESQPNMKPGDKWQQKPSGDTQDNQQEPPSGGHGKSESDTQGEQGGDRSGGGEEGAGQKSQRDGTGSAGQNQSADEGAGESSEQGAGQNSQSAGQDAQSNDRTGQSGSEEEGAGSAERDGKGEKPGGSQKHDGGGDKQPQPNENGEPASAGGDESQSPNKEPGESPSEQPNNGSQDSGASTAGGAGRVPNGTMQPTKSDGTAPAADAANLEYSRKQTDLVLETLAEQMKRQKVDKRLLDELGWTEADLQRFLARWQQLKAAAHDDSPSADAAQRELDDALRSLGLRRGRLEKAKVSDDDNRNLRQGYRGAVPLEYQERLRAYNQGVSRAGQADE
ncbi:MAG: hypothetical protein WD971_00955 [Pirellulales bacterium]